MIKGVNMMEGVEVRIRVRLRVQDGSECGYAWEARG